MINNYIAVGRPTDTIELKQTNSGKSVCSFTLAVDKKEGADFLPMVAWDSTAETLAKFVHKGDKIAIHGEWHSRKYEVDGKNRTAFECTVQRVEFMSKKETEEKTPQFEEVPPDGDLPF